MTSVNRLTREEHRKAKELEAARKAGTAPAEIDEDGKEINPHIPQYISEAPWYLNAKGPGLKHQRSVKKEFVTPLSDWYQRGQKGDQKKSFVKGACTNCGATTHKAKDCCDRPRAKGAKWTRSDIQADDVVQNDPNLTFEAKRDRWNGYDVASHKRVVQEFETVEEERKRQRAKELEAKLVQKRQNAETKKDGEKKEGESSSDDEEEAEALLAQDDGTRKRDEDVEDEGHGQFNNYDKTRRQTVRNLRIREDTAKYLINLNPNSAHYDPKSRSMRENPLADGQEGRAQGSVSDFAGENFVRHTGDTPEFNSQLLFTFQAYEHGKDVHHLANPTQAALLHKQFKEKKENLNKTKSSAVIEKYGGAEYLNAAPKELLLAETEQYVEYGRDGRIVKGMDRATAKSKYLEDVFNANHTQIWGSWWKDGKWGYKCCHQLSKNSYCLGAKGKERAAAGYLEAPPADAPAGAPLAAGEAERPKEVIKIRKRKREDDDDSREGRLKKALEKEDARRKELADRGEVDDRDRAYNSLNYDNKPVTEEEMEAWQMRRSHAEDPMANFKEDDE